MKEKHGKKCVFSQGVSILKCPAIQKSESCSKLHLNVTLKKFLQLVEKKRIRDALHYLVPFFQFKKRKTHP